MVDCVGHADVLSRVDSGGRCGTSAALALSSTVRARATVHQTLALSTQHHRATQGTRHTHRRPRRPSMQRPGIVTWHRPGSTLHASYAILKAVAHYWNRSGVDGVLLESRDVVARLYYGVCAGGVLCAGHARVGAGGDGLVGVGVVGLVVVVVVAVVAVVRVVRVRRIGIDDLCRSSGGLLSGAACMSNEATSGSKWRIAASYSTHERISTEKHKHTDTNELSVSGMRLLHVPRRHLAERY